MDIAFCGAAELAARLRRREIGCEELLSHYLARIEAHDGRVNAVVTLDRERARSRARGADAALARGESWGPLHGLPITVKDAFETAGLRTTGGAKIYEDHVPKQNAVAVQRLIDAGAIVFGKTNLPSLSRDSVTDNAIFGTTNNPHDLTRTPGGSSGGAVAALAAGFTALELGSDIGGSIREPANWTGVYGHKPTHGLVPTRGHIPPRPGSLVEHDLNVAGPLARRASDLRLAMSLLVGPDEDRAVAWQLRLPPPRREALRDYRLAAWLDDPAFPVDASVRSVHESAVEALRRAGVTVDDTARPGVSLTEMFQVYMQLVSPIETLDAPAHVHDAYRAEAARLSPDDVSPAALHARGLAQRHVDWLHLAERRAGYRRAFAAFFTQFDALLCPIATVPAIPHPGKTRMLDRRITVNGAERPFIDFVGWIAPPNLLHLPATAVPVGRTPTGLPVGLQLLGPHCEDLTPLALAEHMEGVVGGFEAPGGFG